MIFSLPSAQSITGYTLVTGSDSNRWLGRNPKSWTLYGCNSATAPGVDDSGWTVIDTVTDDDTMKNASSAAYTFNLDQAAPAYQYYKFQVDKKGQTMQLSELILNYPGSSQTVQQLVQENGKLAVMGKMARALAEPESLEKIWAKLAELMEL